MNLSRARARLAAGVFVAGAVGAVAVAQPQAAAIPAAVRQVLECRNQKEDATRLRCYDTAVAELARTISTGDVVAVSQADVANVRRQAFGFRMPSLSLFDRGRDEKEVERITATVDRAYRRGDGSWVLELDGGGVWAQIDQETIRPPRKGSKVEIRRGAIGSFLINVDGQRAFRAKRLE